MTQKRDFAELIEILSLHKRAYELLASLSRGQRGVFESGGAAALMKVIARKQEVIDSLRVMDARLSRYTTAWDETVAALPDQARREIGDLINEISALVSELKEGERATSELVSETKKTVGKRARRVSESAVAAKAYAGGALAGAGRILDREG